MPYIDSFAQDLLDQDISKILTKLSSNAEIEYGRVEYVFFKILCELAATKMRFTNLNGLVGILETTKAEFQDKILKPYENNKLLESFLKRDQTLTKE